MPAWGPAAFTRATGTRLPRTVSRRYPPVGASTVSANFDARARTGPRPPISLIMSTDFAYLPPLPPIAVKIKAAIPAARVPSERWESLLAAATVLLAGITALIWTTRLDPSDSQFFVTAAAALAVVLPQATFTLLRGTSRRRAAPALGRPGGLCQATITS